MHSQPRNPTPETELPSHLRASPDFQSFACTAIDVPRTPAAVALSAVAAAATIPRAIDTPPVASTESCVSAATEDETSARVSRSSSASQISAVDSIQAAATTAPQQAAASTTAPPPMSEQNLGHIDATAEGFKSLEPTPINSPADTSKLHPNGQASLGASPLLPPPDRSITSHPTSDQNDRLSRGSQHGHGPGHHQSFRQSESPRQLAHPNTPRRSSARQPFSGSASLPGTSAIGIPALAPATTPGTLQNIAHAPSHAPCLHPLAFSPPGIALAPAPAPAPTRGHQHHHRLLSRAQGGYHLGTQYTQHPVTHMLPTVVTPGSGNPPLMASSPSLVPVHHQGALGYCFTYPEYDRFVSEHLTHQHYQHFGYPMQPVYAYDQQGVFQAAGYAPALPDGVYGYPSACAPLFNHPPPSTDLYPSAPMVVSPHAHAGGLSSPPGVVSPHPPNGNGNGDGNSDQCFFGGNGGAQHVENQHGQYAQHHHNHQHAQQRQRQQQQQLAVPRGKPSRGHPPTVPLDLAKKEPVDEYFVAAKRDAQAVNPEVEEPKSAVLERYKKENRERGGCGGGTCTQAQERRKGKGKQHGKEHGKEQSKEHEANFILPSMDELREHVIAFARDQEGTKMLDAWLIRAPPAQLAEALQELRPRLRSLTTDVFGNYTVQTLIRCGGQDVAEEIFDLAIADRVLSLSLHIYGCRVVQAALDVLPRQHRLSMAKEVAPYVLSCAADEQANHVVQKVLEAVQPTEGGAERMALSIAKNALALSKHPFGCRLVQRVLEYCTNDALVEEVVASLMPLALELATHAFGNYVMQAIVEHGSDSARDGILEAVLTDPLTVLMLACDSIASNVMDKCVEACGEPHLEALARALMHPLPSSATTADNAGASTPLVLLACDPYGNHVLQRVLARVQNGEREMLLEVLRPHVAELKNNDFGRHVARKLEQLF